MNWRTWIVVLPLVAFAPVQAASGEERNFAATFYVAQTSTEEGWEDVFINPLGADYADDFLAVASVSRRYARFYEGALQLEMEGQVAYHFGQQENWEFNAVPVVARWRQFPWSHRLATTAAFGLGLSYTTRLPELEVELEGESHQTLIYWVAELTAGLPERPWAVSLRLHHRSVGYGLMGEEGGMNAVGLGLRWQFQ
jgi:hypothetical protein